MISSQAPDRLGTFSPRVLQALNGGCGGNDVLDVQII